MRSFSLASRAASRDDLLDEVLAGLVLGMGLAGEDNLQAAGLGGNLARRVQDR